jgi:hypothetical protein
MEFSSPSVSKELKGEEETGWRRFSGGSECFMMTLWFASSCMEEGGSQQRTARRWCRWKPEGRRCRWKPEVGADGETKMGREPRRLQYNLFLFFEF